MAQLSDRGDLNYLTMGTICDTLACQVSMAHLVFKRDVVSIFAKIRNCHMWKNPPNFSTSAKITYLFLFSQGFLSKSAEICSFLPNFSRKLSQISWQKRMFPKNLPKVHVIKMFSQKQFLSFTCFWKVLAFWKKNYIYWCENFRHFRKFSQAVFCENAKTNIFIPTLDA